MFKFKWFLAMCFWWWVLTIFLDVRAERLAEANWPEYGWAYTTFFWFWAVGSTLVFLGAISEYLEAPARHTGRALAAFGAGFALVWAMIPKSRK